MIIKITDGCVTHFIEFSGAVQVMQVPDMHPENWGECGVEDEPTSEWNRFITCDEDENPEMNSPGVLIRPEGVPLRTYLTNMDAYLMSDKGKTIEVLHRYEDHTPAT